MKSRIVRVESVITKLMVVLLTIITAFIFAISCAGEESTTAPTPVPTTTAGQTTTPVLTTTPVGTVTPPPTPSPPLTAEWAPDGVISAREYHNIEIHGNYEIHWKSDEQFIYVGMKAKTEGFVAVGFQPGSRMKNADIVFGFVKDGQASVYDMFSTGDFGPHPLDTELGGTDDIIDFGGKENAGHTTIEFKRALVTDDEYDNALSSGKNGIIWSYGSSDNLTLRHSNRGYGEIDL